MKNFILLASCFALALLSPSLQGQNCSVATSVTTLNANAVNATIPHAGDFFWDGTSDTGYTITDDISGEEVRIIYGGGLWISGFKDGSLKQAASLYGIANGNTDYWPGPLDEFGVANSESCTNWDRHWEVTETDIDAFRADWSDGGVSLNDIPSSIAGWPAIGNPLFFDINGFELPNSSQQLAPFHDLAGDGIYDPTDGDYPLIKGDQAVFWIFNDAGNYHGESAGTFPINMEIHAMAYGIASTNDNINNAIFYDLTFIYKGTTPFQDAYVGLWLDPYFGCFLEGSFGSIPEENMAYIYNTDTTDIGGIICPTGEDLFGEGIPMLGIKMLEGVKAGRVYNADGELEIPDSNEVPDVFVDLGLTSFTYYNNAGQNPPPTPGTGDPDFTQEYYNLLSGLWTDGTPMTKDGDGLNPAGEETTYAFDGNPSEPGEWSMCHENLSQRDRRILLSSGPFTMESGATNSISFSVFHTSANADPCPSTANLVDAANDIENLYSNISPVETLDNSLNVSLSPNPFSNETLLQLKNLDASIERLDLYNVSGLLIRSYNETSSNTIVIERGNLTTGMYFYKLVTSKQQYVAGKFFVQ